MKKDKLLALIDRFAAPVLLAVCGLILLCSPDSASALVSRLLGWGLVAAGVIWLLMPGKKAVQFVTAAACIIVGIWLVNHPLALARGLGKLLGLLLALRGGQELFRSQKTAGRLLSLAMLLLGVLLVALPMTTSRLVFGLIGLLVIAEAVAMFLNRLREGKYLEGGSSDIIDAL